MKKKVMKELREVVIILGVFGLLYATGLHTEVFGTIQGLFLKTGLVTADTNESEGEASYDFSLVDMEGNTLSMESLKGKVVFMNLWATWCPPCVAEMPSIHNLYREVHNDDIVFVMISVDREKEKVGKFMERKGFTFPVYQLASSLPKEFESNSIPTTFVISPEGEIVMKHVGMADYDNKKFRNFLNGLLENKK